jgi:hypothetical protein
MVGGGGGEGRVGEWRGDTFLLLEDDLLSVLPQVVSINHAALLRLLLLLLLPLLLV